MIILAAAGDHFSAGDDSGEGPTKRSKTIRPVVGKRQDQDRGSRPSMD
jgi:hypothetical protein